MKKNYTLIICFLLLGLVLAACRKEEGGMAGPDGPGSGGSLARFTIAGNHLYTVDNTNLKTYQLTAEGGINLKSNIQIGWEIETIYPYDDKLFIGSRTAMYIFDISDPNKPKQVGLATHVRACDPVVAVDKTAYVTVRTGTSCGGATNSLLVYDVTNVQKPIQKKSINLDNPHGLGVHDQALYVCDGTAGLRVFDIQQPLQPQEISIIKGFKFYDCIPFGDLLICMVDDGMVLYDISDPLAPKFLTQNPQHS